MFEYQLKWKSPDLKVQIDILMEPKHIEGFNPFCVKYIIDRIDIIIKNEDW